MSEPKPIAEGLEKGLKKFQEFASRMAEQATGEIADCTRLPEKNGGQELQIAEYKTVIYEYRDAIERLHPPDRKIWDVWGELKQADILGMLSRIRENRYFGKSKPEIDLTFLVVLCSQYSNSHVSRKLNKAYLWLLSNPGKEKKNYRRFIMNFMEDRTYENR